MKIYQIHETGGQWEDYFDYIVGTYLHKDRAESEMQKLVDKEECRRKGRRKCRGCPINHTNSVDDSLEAMQKACSEYCNVADIQEDSDYCYCENEVTHWDDNDYHIKEIEVIE